MAHPEPLTLADIAADPACLSRNATLPDGQPAQLRLLLPGDGDAFGRFLDELGETTRSLYAPHPLDLAQGRQLCAELDYAGMAASPDPVALRFVGLIEPGPAHIPTPRPQDAANAETTSRERQFAARQDVGSYFILLLGVGDPTVERYRGHGVALDPGTTCTFAPVVADAYQNKGVGSALVPGVFDAARRLGFATCVLMGGTRTVNHRAIRYYEKAGFRTVGAFDTKSQDGATIGNQDMVLAL